MTRKSYERTRDGDQRIDLYRKKMMIDFTKYADMNEASEITGLGRQRLYVLIMTGELNATKFFNRNFFLKEDLEKFTEYRSTRRRLRSILRAREIMKVN